MDVEVIGDLRLFTVRRFVDARGEFFEGWNSAVYANHGVPELMPQLNFSRSVQGVIRGLHYQVGRPQGKLVMCLAGAVRDVAVDIREDSPDYGRHWCFELSESNGRQLYIPPGFAHGFEVLSESALFGYMVSAPYDAAGDRAIRFDDPTLGIEWQSPSPIVSEKDRLAPLFRAGSK